MYSAAALHGQEYLLRAGLAFGGCDTRDAKLSQLEEENDGSIVKGSQDI